MTSPEKAVTWILVALLGVACGLAAFFGLFLGMASDSCGSGVDCDYARIGAGVAIASGGPLLIFVATLVGVGLRVRGGRSAWWLPLVAAPLVIAPFVLGAYVATSGVPG